MATLSMLNAEIIACTQCPRLVRYRESIATMKRRQYREWLYWGKPIPGFGELFRWLSYAGIGTSTIQSRADAGVCGDTIVFLLPGSPGACRLGMEQIILPQLDLNHRPCNLTELLPRIRKEQEPHDGA